MNEPMDVVTRLLKDVILPNLQAVVGSQKDQMAANDRLEAAIEELRRYLDSQFALLQAQLTACRAEVAALEATVTATQRGAREPGRTTMVH